MPNETVKFVNGAQTWRIQFEIVAPPSAPPQKPGTFSKYGAAAQFKVNTIRVTETTEGVGDDGQKKVVNFARGFDNLAQARTGATEYAKRIVREKLTPKAPPAEQPADQ